MSEVGYRSMCPKCGLDMDCYKSWEPYDTVSGQCMECGFYYYTKEAQMSLEEVNELRTERDLPPLRKLKPQTNQKGD